MEMNALGLGAAGMVLSGPARRSSAAAGRADPHLLERAEAAGLGGLDNSAVIEAIREQQS